MQWHIILCTQTRINSTLLLACAFCALIELSNIHFLFYVHAHTLTHALTLKQTHTRLLLCTGCNHHVIARGYIYITLFIHIYLLPSATESSRITCYGYAGSSPTELGRSFATDSNLPAAAGLCLRVQLARTLFEEYPPGGAATTTPASLHATTSTDEAPMVCIVWFIVCRERSRRERF